MKAAEFVQELERCAPTIDALTRIAGLSRAHARAVRASYVCSRRRKPTSVPVQDELATLVADFHANGIEVGQVTLSDGPAVEDDHIVVGGVGGDDLAIDFSSNQVVVVECGTRHRLWACADSGERFLDALRVLACFFARQAVSREPLDRCAAIAECICAAGGQEYENFYKMLLMK